MNETFSTKNFERVQLREISNIKPGVNVSSKKMGYGSLYVTVENLYENRFINLAKLSKADIGAKNQKEHRLEYKDIVLSKSSVKKEGIGYGCIFRNRSKLVIPSGFTVRIRSNKDKCDANFLFYSLRSYETRKWIINYSQTSALTNLNAGIINSIPISLPSIPEQKKIASILNSVDDLIEKTQSQINKLQDLKKGTMNELLTKGIGHAEFKDSELGRIPKSWDIVSLDSVSKIIMGQSPNSSSYNNNRVGLPFFQGKTDFGDYFPMARIWCSKPLKVAPVSSILLTVRAPVGDINITKEECCIGRGLAAIQAESINSDFLFENLKFLKNKFNFYSQGTTFEAINQSDLKSFKIMKPSLSEQKKIITILKSINNNASISNVYLKKIVFLKKSLMQDLLTGKVRVSVN